MSLTREAIRSRLAARDRAARALREDSLIAFAIERVFRRLQRLSPSTFLQGTQIDWYILGWTVAGATLATALYTWGPNQPSAPMPVWLSVLALAVAGLRVLDLVQVAINAGLFDQLTFSGETDGRPQEVQNVTPQEVQNVTRSLVLLIVNYVELIFWFALIYMALQFSHTVSFWARFYFSAITQLTIGYGDITPLHAARGVAAVQGIAGWVVTVLVIARFVSALRPLRAQLQ